MATYRLAPDFRELLKLLHGARVEYLLVGGYAVGYYGYPRATMDMDIWVAVHPANAAKVSEAMQRFGFPAASVPPALFLRPGEMVRLGAAPMRLEILTELSGVHFEACWRRRRRVRLDGVVVNLIGLADLRRNKRASARHKDLDDLSHLPRRFPDPALKAAR